MLLTNGPNLDMSLLPHRYARYAESYVDFREYKKDHWERKPESALESAPRTGWRLVPKAATQQQYQQQQQQQQQQHPWRQQLQRNILARAEAEIIALRAELAACDAELAAIQAQYVIE